MTNLSTQATKYRIEDIFSKTDQDSFRKYFFIQHNYSLTLSKTIRETDVDKDLLFFFSQVFSRKGEVLDTFERRFNSISDPSPFYRNYSLNYDNSTSESPIPQGSSTLPQSISDVYHRVILIFSSALDESFEDGMESHFSRDLEKIISQYAFRSVNALITILLDPATNEELVSEALRVLSRINQPETYNIRLWLLEQSLRNYSARIRDSAIIGLSSFDDPKSISTLKEAIQKETCPELREDMRQVLRQLEISDTCH
jgi:hypothetical protein